MRQARGGNGGAGGSFSCVATGDDAPRMELSELATAQKAQQVRHDMDVGMLKKLQNQQKAEGEAAVSLIQSSSVAQGAPEPGKGGLVDVRA